MMTEISLNILDVAENSTRAKASLVEIFVEIDTKANRLYVTVRDDGCGMDKEQLARVEDPFLQPVRPERSGWGFRFLNWQR